MNREVRVCPKCGGEMRAGFLKPLPINDYAERNDELEWVEGNPEWSRWTRQPKLSGRERRRIVTYSCADCGYLESYAAGRVG